MRRRSEVVSETCSLRTERVGRLSKAEHRDLTNFSKTWYG